MHTTVKLAAAGAAAALLAACGGGASIPNQPNTLPATAGTSGSAPQSHVMYEDGAAVHIMFTRDLSALGGGASAPGHAVALSKAASTSGNLLYNGGPVQTAPKIYVVFWGSAWNSTSGDPDGMKSYLLDFYAKVAGSKWLNSVTQYYQSNGQHVGNSGITISSWVDTGSSPPSRPRQNNLASEAQRGAAHFGDYSASASYVVVSPHGIKPSGFGTQYCAWHSSTSSSGGTLAYTNLPYIPDAGGSCGSGSVNSPGTLDGVSIVGGHEQGETETDPQPNTGWLDSSGSENGDKCAWTNLENNPNAGGYPTQPLWSNATSSCVQSY